MTLIDKDKFIKGMDKAADVANNAAEKAEEFIKEKELDKKAIKAVNKMGSGLVKLGEKMENAFTEEKVEDTVSKEPKEEKSEE